MRTDPQQKVKGQGHEIFSMNTLTEVVLGRSDTVHGQVTVTMGSGGEIKTVNIFLGFFFVVNFCLGTGFLGIPYAFFYSGYLAAIPTLLLISVVSWINANYLLEVMARAQVSVM